MSGHIGDLNESQEQALNGLKAKLNDLDEDLSEYANNFCDDTVLLRFLRARKFNVDNAFDMLSEALRFRTSFQDKGVDGMI